MTATIYDETVSALLPRLVRDVLAADADLVAFFGTDIFEVDYEEIEQPLRVPSLAVLPGLPSNARIVGGDVSLVYPIHVLALLPRATPAIRTLAIPAAPTAATSTTGPLTGTFGYRITQTSSLGESYASDSVAVTVTGKAPVLTLPALGTGATGFRIWRTPAGRSCYRHVATLPGGASTWTDTTADTNLGDELAPVRYFGERLTDWICRTLYKSETLWDGTQYTTDAVLLCEPQLDRIIGGRNIRMRAVKAAFRTVVDSLTNVTVVG